jgi:hypothetical protein
MPAFILKCPVAIMKTLATLVCLFRNARRRLRSGRHRMAVPGPVHRSGDGRRRTTGDVHDARRIVTMTGGAAFDW